ncbi:MAG: hypothetical protein COV45_09395 [Deltaproteobacteria bacterium CG11_big_fil_rev_8_21_14_0_20_47_16]|nr:MAG: hypothetical protein COV45_09395 [Deltaproteobacteria bacterium CG11_big_fil_rev_8_21_14_0_20_47_16]
MRKLFVLLTLIFASHVAHAQSMADQLKNSPLGKIPVGVLTGVLTKEGKPLANYPLVIQVQQSGQTVLTLPKNTDANGTFEFKNIFRAPEFSYSVFSEDAGKVYRYGPFAMKDAKLKISFAISAKTEIGEMPSQPKAAASEPVPEKGEWVWYQVVALLMLGAVLGALGTVIVNRRRK